MRASRFYVPFSERNLTVERKSERVKKTKCDRGRSHEKEKLKVVSARVIDGARFVKISETSDEGLHRWKDTGLVKAGAVRSYRREVHNIFVDHLLELMHREWMKQLFAQCGSITEVKIP
ncbi:hypothetical protein U1Q18_017134 [Sarracenia purpurea var. burkii]